MQLAVWVVSGSLLQRVISERVSDLTISSRREGILSTYSSSWNNWASWCVEQNVDPVRCNMNWILDFLAFLFESGYEYTTICAYMSAISALHHNIEGKPVGEQSEVSSLIEMCSIIDHLWDLQLVLGYLKKNLPNNSSLSNKPLTFKVAILLALT